MQSSRVEPRSYSISVPVTLKLRDAGAFFVCANNLKQSSDRLCNRNIGGRKWIFKQSS